MKRSLFVAALAVLSASAANAEDLAAGATSFKKCVTCHDPPRTRSVRC
jgi:cytochrome c2